MDRQTKTLTFRLPLALAKALSNRAQRYGFGSLAEFMSLALTSQVYKAHQGRFKAKSYMPNCTIVCGCRVTNSVYQSIGYFSERHLRDTKSAWCGLALYYWLVELDNFASKNDKRLRKTGPWNWHEMHGQRLLEHKPGYIDAINEFYTQLV